jgi:alpha-beta hydrolase superfamily lysophospholipase
VQNPAQPTVKNASSQAIPLLLDAPGTRDWLVTSDATRHPVRIWPVDQPRAVAVYLHGIEGHSLWFAPTTAVLNKAGVTVYGPDRRGAGESAEPSGDVSSYKVLVRDLVEQLRQIAQRHPGVPIFLVANCWGAKVGVAAAAETGKLIAGIVMISPAVATQVDVAFLTKLKIGLDYLLNGGRSYFDIPLTPQHFTDNPPYLQFIADDPLRLKKATARFFIESLKLTRAARNAAPALQMPVLILQSGRDAIVDLPGIEGWFASIGSKDKTMRIFTSAAHSLDFEAEPAEYQNLLASWITSRAAQPSQTTGVAG